MAPFSIRQFSVPEVCRSPQRMKRIGKCIYTRAVLIAKSTTCCLLFGHLNFSHLFSKIIVGDLDIKSMNCDLTKGSLKGPNIDEAVNMLVFGNTILWIGFD